MADYINDLTWAQDGTDAHVFRALVADSDSTVAKIAVLMASTHETYRWYLYDGSTLTGAPHPYSVAANLITNQGLAGSAQEAYDDLVAAIEVVDAQIAESKGTTHGADQIKAVLGL